MQQPAPGPEPEPEPGPRRRERRNSLDNGRSGRARRNSLVALQDAAATYDIDESFLNDKLGEVLLHGFLEKRSSHHGLSDAHAATLAALDTQLPIQPKSRKPERRGSFSKLVQRGRRPSIGDLSPVARRALQATLAVGSSKKRVEPMQIEGDLTLPSPRS